MEVDLLDRCKHDRNGTKMTWIVVVAITQERLEVGHGTRNGAASSAGQRIGREVADISGGEVIVIGVIQVDRPFVAGLNGGSDREIAVMGQVMDILDVVAALEDVYRTRKAHPGLRLVKGPQNIVPQLSRADLRVSLVRCHCFHIELDTELMRWVRGHAEESPVLMDLVALNCRLADGSHRAASIRVQRNRSAGPAVGKRRKKRGSGCSPKRLDDVAVTISVADGQPEPLHWREGCNDRVGLGGLRKIGLAISLAHVRSRLRCMQRAC